MQSEFSGRHVASFLDMGIVKWCHPGDHVSMPPFGRYYRKKLVTLDCGLLVGNGVSSSTSHPHLLGWFVLVPVIGKISFVLSNIKQSWNFCSFCTQNIAASNIQPIRRHPFGILLLWFVGTRRTLHQESGLKNLEPTSSIFWLFVRPQGLQIGFPNFMVLVFSPLGSIQGHNVRHLLVTWGRLKIFFCVSALTPSLKPLGLISTFAPIGMLDLSCTLALTPSVNWA